MSNELATLPVKDLELMAQRVARSRLFGMDENQLFTLMLLCQARGLHPIEAVSRYDVIQGRPAMKASAMLAEFQRIGGTVQWKSGNDNDDMQAAEFSHPRLSPKPTLVKFSMKDAAKAGLNGKDTWKKYPANMLRARVISNAMGMIAPGITGGVYTPEEVGDFDPPPPFVEMAREAQAVVDIQQRNPEPYVESFPEQQTLLPPAPTSRQQMDGETSRHDPQGWAQAEADRQTEKQRPRSDVERLLKEMVRAANDHWQNWQKMEGVSEVKPLLTVFQLENHIGSELIRDKVIEEKVIATGGKRNRIKQLEVLERCQAKNREKFDAMVSEYFAKLMGDGAAALGILAPFDDRDSEPAEAEEMAS